MTFITVTEEIPIRQWQCDILNCDKQRPLSNSIFCNRTKSPAHLCDIVPQAPCLLVRILRIFCFSWLAVTWSRCLAALMRWSHIFSSSLRSAAYWAQLDWRRAERLKPGLDWELYRPIPAELPQIQRVCAHPLPSVCSRWIPLRWQLALCDPSWRGTEVWRGRKTTQHSSTLRFSCGLI